MNMGKKGAFLLLTVMVLWTVTPVCACLLAPQPMGQHACCRAMAHECGTPSAALSGSCCRIHPEQTASASGSTPVHQRPQRLAFVAQHFTLPAAATPNPVQATAFEAPPPKFSSSGSFSLRI